MSAPLLWIIFPGLMGISLFFVRYRTRLVILTSAGTTLFLAWTAWQIPIDEVISLGPLSIKISETLSVFGREFSFTNLERPLLAFLFLSSFLWILGSYIAQPGQLFVPSSLVMVSLLIAALAVEPFLYAALLIEISVLLSIPLLAPPHKPAGRGVFRFLAFQTFGMPFILFTGWMLAGVGASSTNLDLIIRAGALLGLGFAFLLAVFPFHTWIPMLAREIHPYIAAFIFFIIPTAISLFALGFLDRFVWLREEPSVYLLLRIVGIIMVVIGGVWAGFQTHLGKMFGYAVVMEIGLSLAAIGLGNSLGVSLYIALLLPRLISFIVWASALALLYRISRENLLFDSVQGVGIQYPFIAFSLLAAQLSLTGIPLFAGFPVRIALWSELSKISPALAFGALVGNAALLAGSLRALLVLMKPVENTHPPEGASTQEGSTIPLEHIANTSILLFVISSGLLLIIGLFPQWFYPALNDLPLMFEHLGI